MKPADIIKSAKSTGRVEFRLSQLSAEFHGRNAEHAIGMIQDAARARGLVFFDFYDYERREWVYIVETAANRDARRADLDARIARMKALREPTP